MRVISLVLWINLIFVENIFGVEIVVKVMGGENLAKEVAKKNGFDYRGPVSSLLL